MSSGLPGPGTAAERARRGVRVIAALACIALLSVATYLPLSWQEQAVFALFAAVSAVALSRLSQSSFATWCVVLISCFSTARYAFWRVATVHQVLRRHGAHPPLLDACFLLLLLGAEAYSIATLGLGYLQMIWPLRRSPAAMSGDVLTWPEVDLLIPTINEPLHVLKYTALAALNMDWPPNKLNVYVLDDGRREEVRSFCAEAGIGYMVRDTDTSAKAGNLNAALARLKAPFVAVFDADHAPVRSFLQMTMGWFDRDPLLGFVQTPQHLYSPDPFDRNLRQFRAVPNESELFYGVVQDGNDLWNATYFCGTGAVLRRAALDSVGGFATETVTEDAHTSLRLHKEGWNSAYLNLPLAAGLAPERLSAHIRQRRRWARGMVQMLRLENPLLGRGLTWPQRLCYFHACMHFLNALPRLVFLLAPLSFLVLGRVSLPGYWAAILAYGLPHLLLAYLANSRLQGPHRFSFWNEIYETVMAPFLVVPTLMALAFPHRGRFGTTAKGEFVETGFFDSRAAWPMLLLFGANVVGLLCVALRYVPLGTMPWYANAPSFAQRWLWLLQHQAPAAVWINVGWVFFNLMILSVALGVARESRQRRRAVRLQKSIEAGLVFSDGRWLQGQIEDASSGGLLVRTRKPVEAHAQEAVSIVLSVQGHEIVLPATVVDALPRALRVHFDPLTLKEEEALAMILFSPADTWVGWGPAQEPDRLLKSFGRVLGLAAKGLGSVATAVVRPAAIRFLALAGVGLLLGFASLWMAPMNVRAQDTTSPGSSVDVPGATSPKQDAGRSSFRGPGSATERRIPLSAMTGAQSLRLDAVASSVGVHFEVAPNEIIERASLQLRFRAPGLPAGSAVHVLLNGVALPAEAGMQQATEPNGPGKWNDLRLNLPAELLVHNNELELRNGTGTGPVEIDVIGSALQIVERTFAVSVETSERASTSRGSAGSILSYAHQWTQRWSQLSPEPVLPPALNALLFFWYVAACCLALAGVCQSALRARARLRLQT